MQLGINIWEKSTDNILSIEDDSNLVFWEENITYFLFIKDYSKFTNNRRHCPILMDILASLIVPRFVHEPLCVVWKLVCEGHQPSADLCTLIINQFGNLV